MEDPFHVPQQSRRNKLRFTPPQNDAILQQPLFSSQPLHDASSSMAVTGGLNLSLSTHARCSDAYGATPVGPFTGYASILGRSRFLRPAHELLEDFCRGNIGVSSFENDGSKLLVDSRSWFDGHDDDISRRCSNPNLVSMLQEAYKRYKLYCQQMHSAVTSFQSVAGLGNAAPFVCFAIKAMFRHFHCLKKAILDHIHVTSKTFGSVDVKRDRTSGSCSEDKVHFDQKQVLESNFLQHPVWRSQRGFPDKAVAVLRTWLFDHFLHPYPNDSDKQMLAQKTGLSRSQVSNWFTNARVRLWKPMVEEMHALERKTQSSKAVDTQKLDNISADQHIPFHPQLTQKDFQFIYTHRDDDSHSKRTRIEVFQGIGQPKEQFGLTCNHRVTSNQVIDIGGSQSGDHRNSENTTTGLSWSTHEQIVPFWLSKP